MKADIRDRVALSALRPSEVVTYLRSRGWVQAPDAGNATWASFTLNDFEIALPLTQDFRDFANRISDAIRTLEIVEERDQFQILADLSLANADVVRVRVLDPEANDGTLPLDRAVDIIDNTYGLMLAAACAAVVPKLYYPARKPAQATDYMRQVRMGQTERGSFVVTVISHVQPEMVPPEEAAELGLPEPFEPRVTVKLGEAMDAVHHAAGQAIATGSLRGFEEAVERGVSANLCNALGGLSTSIYGSRPVGIDMAWARSRRIPPPTRRQIVVTPDFAPVLKDAADLLKAKAPREEYEMIGFVFRLRSDTPGSHAGEVTVAADVDGEQRSVWLDLRDDDYRLAVQAHHERRLLRAIGVLRKEGRSYRLRYPRDLQIFDVE